MLFIRPVALKYLGALLRLSVEVGTGMTSMPNDEGTWLARIRLSQDTFADESTRNDEGVYFMVAEDSKTNEVVGTTAIYVGIGTTTPFYSYKQALLVKYSKDLQTTIEIKMLNLVNDLTRSSEVGSLFLSASYRHSSYGQFMSRSRYLLMADFPNRFATDVIAEMRGWQTQSGHSPFWQALGKKFFNLPFENADYISATKGSQFIQDLMPKYPVYIDLLPEEAQTCIGKPHTVSAKAIHLLEKEGFRYDGYIDVFDGGPTVHCRREQIQSVRDAKTYHVRISESIVNTRQRYLISNTNISHYRIVVQPANLNEKMVEITSETAEVLGIVNGDIVNLFGMMEKNHD
ncbi:MAG: arginine N-succinyltransferase [Ostreibacterium sp.]